MYWNSVSIFGAHLQFQYHSCEEIVYFSRDFSTAFFHNTPNTEVTSGQQVLYRCFHCARLESMYWNSVSTNGAHLHFQYHSCEEIVYFSRNSSTTLIQCIQHTEVTANKVKSYLFFQSARLESIYWNSVSTFGAHLQFQYHSCEEIVYFSRDFSTAFFHNIQIPKSHRANRCYTNAFIVQDLNRNYWNSVSTFGANLQFQCHICEETVYFSRDFSTAFFHHIQNTEVASGQQVLYRCFHCARLESKYWNSVSTKGAHLHFQYHSCEEIVYCSRYFSTACIQNSQYTVVTANQLNSYRWFLCARLESMYWNSVSSFGAHRHFQYHCCEEIVYFSRDCSASFIQCIQLTDVTANKLKSYRCFHCVRLESVYWNSVSTIGAHLHIQYHCCE